MSEKIIPFYGGKYPRLFEIERRCMDRDGLVIRFLDLVLPRGKILDIGAGNGFTAAQLANDARTVVPFEPDSEMIDGDLAMPWVRGVAQDLPFQEASFNAAYATWAFFFSGLEQTDEGLKEARRVVVPGGPIVIIDNAGDDAFCSLSERDIASDSSWWEARGFERTVLNTAFRFDTVDEARELLTFYFGEAADTVSDTEIEYKVAAYVGSAGCA